jgi:hypothetical protein
VGHQTLPADGPAGRSRGHRLTALLLAPMGARSKTTTTQQPSNRMTKNESAKNSGHYPFHSETRCPARSSRTKQRDERGTAF